ncbi:Hypothetical predicted protein, partial [Pelobates cultripes]
NKPNLLESLLLDNPLEGDISKQQSEENEGRRIEGNDYDNLLKHLDIQFGKMKEEIQANTLEIKKELLTLGSRIQGIEEKLDLMEQREKVIREEYTAI